MVSRALAPAEQQRYVSHFIAVTGFTARETSWFRITKSYNFVLRKRHLLGGVGRFCGWHLRQLAMHV